MKTTRFSDNQMMQILKLAEAGTPVPTFMPRAWYEYSAILQMAC